MLLMVDGRPLVMDGRPLVVDGRPLVVDGRPLHGGHLMVQCWLLGVQSCGQRVEGEDRAHVCIAAIHPGCMSRVGARW